VYETISVEERNKPAVGLIYKDFANDARQAQQVCLARLVENPL
jgi:hypothetical protein